MSLGIKAVAIGPAVIVEGDASRVIYEVYAIDILGNLWSRWSDAPHDAPWESIKGPDLLTPRGSK